MDETTICTLLGEYFFYPLVVKTQIRLNIIKNEIIRNIPKIKTEPEALLIHIRGGDVFSYYVHGSYDQPPLCF